MTRFGFGVALLAAAAVAMPAQAYLYWTRPALAGVPVTGAEPGLVVPLAGATPKEMQANLVWSMRAGLNVAALQCQFAPVLMTVSNYNVLIKQHAAELDATMKTLQAYFKRTDPKNAMTAFDQYTTRTYNGFSTMHAQYGFCDTAASIGREVLDQGRGKLGMVAANRMREFRNSLVPAGDAAFAFNAAAVPMTSPDNVPPICYDKKGREKVCKPPRN